MTVWAVIPMRPLGEGKTRLSNVLSSNERKGLTQAMLTHVVKTVRAARNVDHTFVISQAHPELGIEVALLSDRGDGLNAAVRSATLTAMKARVSRLVVLHGDLPQLDLADVERLAGAVTGTVLIAPDRHNAGTNAISLPLPLASSFTFKFGQGSCAQHHAEALRLGLKTETICSRGLSHDIDEPSDLPYAMHLLASGQTNLAEPIPHGLNQPDQRRTDAAPTMGSGG